LQCRLDTLDRLGAKLVRYTVDWRYIAKRKPKRAVNPGDPAYDWSDTDAVLDGLPRVGRRDLDAADRRPLLSPGLRSRSPAGAQRPPSIRRKFLQGLYRLPPGA
jgi:hypothetical protein